MFNKRHIVRTIAATVSILALSFTAACGSGQSTASNCLLYTSDAADEL